MIQLLPNMLQRSANEKWICSPLEPPLLYNEQFSDFPASIKYGQAANFTVAPSNTEWLENPPTFLTEQFIKLV